MAWRLNYQSNQYLYFLSQVIFVYFSWCSLRHSFSFELHQTKWLTYLPSSQSLTSSVIFFGLKRLWKRWNRWECICMSSFGQEEYKEKKCRDIRQFGRKGSVLIAKKTRNVFIYCYLFLFHFIFIKYNLKTKQEVVTTLSDCIIMQLNVLLFTIEISINQPILHLFVIWWVLT